MSLSVALKQLIKQGGNALPSPGPSVLSPVFSKTLVEARKQGAERGWLAVATATLLTVNSPDAVGHLYTFAGSQYSASLNPSSSSSSWEEDTGLLPLSTRVSNAALMREAALKCAVFVGVPKVINSLAGLTARYEDDVKERLRTIPIRTLKNSKTPREVENRGKRLFSSVYDPHTEKLLAKLGSYHPDFPGFIVHNEYGALLSDPLSSSDWPLEGRVGRTLTSAVGVACLRVSGGVGPQLVSHVYGLIKAKDYHEQYVEKSGTGGSDIKPDESEGPGEAWLASDEGATWVVSVADRIGGVFENGESSSSEKSKL